MASPALSFNLTRFFILREYNAATAAAARKKGLEGE